MTQINGLGSLATSRTMQGQGAQGVEAGGANNAEGTDRAGAAGQRQPFGPGTGSSGWPPRPCGHRPMCGRRRWRR